MAPYVYAPLTIIGGAVLTWWAIKRLGHRAVAVAVALVAGHVALAALLTDHPGRGAIGYANANAALAVQLIAAAGVLALTRTGKQWGWVGVGLGIAALLANDSQGGSATAVLVVIAILLAHLMPRGRRRWPAAIGSLAISGAAVLTLISLARHVHWSDPVLDALDPVRRTLWNVAWLQFRRAETFGYGPGGFAQGNPLARDADTMSAHSLPLQAAAELGGVGLILLTLLFLCGLAWAALSVRASAAWIAIAAWTALSAHAFMDHLVEFWPVTLAAGLVLGCGLATEPDTEVEDQPV